MLFNKLDPVTEKIIIYIFTPLLSVGYIRTKPVPAGLRSFGIVFCGTTDGRIKAIKIMLHLSHVVIIFIGSTNILCNHLWSTEDIRNWKRYKKIQIR